MHLLSVIDGNYEQKKTILHSAYRATLIWYFRLK